MATVSTSVVQSNNDGYQPWDNRGNPNALYLTTALRNPIIGPHYDDSLNHAAFFIFRIDNMPKNSVINECKISLRTNNSYTGGLTNHIYVAVENNLDVNSTGRPVVGTLGTLPYQRLGRQTAATTLFGNRCGPTHNKPGDTLSSYGAHVRDLNALIYKAFCTNQSSGAALGRDLLAGTWEQSENFAGAIQPLVDDPAWNSTTQYVMVYLFADLSSGTTYNIGSLSGYTWNNNTVGASTAYGNGGGQYYTYDHNVGQYAPKLDITYTHSSFISSNTKSKSSGFVRFTPALCLGRLMGERAELNDGNSMIPKMSDGAHDLPFTGMLSVNPNSLDWLSGNALGSRVKWSDPRPGRVDGKAVILEDYASGPDELKKPQIWWDVAYHQDDYTTRSVYSMRFYHRYEQYAWLNIDQNVVSFQHLGSEVFRVEHQQLIYHPPNDPDTQMELRIAWSGSGTSWTNYQFTPPSGNGFYRYEIQVDADANPKVRVRVYLNDNVTPIEVLTANPPTVDIDRIMIGDTNINSPILNSKVSDVEIWSDYTLNRQFPADINNTVGTPYNPQKWQWFEYDGGIASSSLEDLGTISSIDPGGSSVVMTSPSAALTLEDTKSEVWVGDTDPYTKYSNLQYGVGDRRKLDLFVPLGTPPSGGWPVIVFTHGGFWTSGDKNDLYKQMINHAIINGFAIATCNYVLNAETFLYLGDSYPAWDPNIASGRYPSVIINFKEATHYLQSVVATTYNLNPLRFIACGHSAGGYNALAAAVSKGLTNDGGGRNLTLAGNTATFGSPNVSDPSYLGAYILSGPINLSHILSYDPTYPDWEFLSTGLGIMGAAFRALKGQTMDGSMPDMSNYGVDDMILANASNIVPKICYVWSPHDFLVPSSRETLNLTQYSQEKALADALNSVSGSLPSGFTYESHAVVDSLHHTIHYVDFDYSHFVKWLKSLW